MWWSVVLVEIQTSDKIVAVPLISFSLGQGMQFLLHLL